MDLLCFSVLCLLCFCMHLFICALGSPAGKGLTSWLSFVVSSCEFVTFPLGRRRKVPTGPCAGIGNTSFRPKTSSPLVVSALVVSPQI